MFERFDKNGLKSNCNSVKIKRTWGVDRIDHTDSKSVQAGETPVLLAIVEYNRFLPDRQLLFGI